MNPFSIGEGVSKDNPREWFKAIYSLCYQLRVSNEFNHITIKLPSFNVRVLDVMPRFSRYEGKTFLIFHFQLEGSPKNLKELEQIQENLSVELEDHFADYLQPNFSVNIKVEKFQEALQIQNPIPIYINQLSEFEVDERWGKVETSQYNKYYQIDYIEQNSPKNKKGNFLRELKIIYLLSELPTKDGEQTKERSPFFDMVHTEFMFFIRGKALEEKFHEPFSKINFLQNVTELLENEWVRIRTLFSILPKFVFGKHDINRIRYLLLEVKAHSISLTSNIKFKMEKEKRFYEEAFERLHFTIQKRNNKNEIDYYKKLNEYAFSSYEAYTDKLEILESSISRLDYNINQLRDDFDSYSNVILQSFMFLLSLILVFASGVALIFEKMVESFAPWGSGFSLIVIPVFVGIAIILAILASSGKMFINKPFNLGDEDSSQTLENWLGSSKTKRKKKKNSINIEQQINEIKPDNEYQKTTISILKILTVLVAGVSINRTDTDYAAEVVKRLEKRVNYF